MKTIVFGCDPELFIKRNGQIIGAERLIPREGIEYIPGTFGRDGNHTSKSNKNGKIVLDGVQLELNPRANTCRANLGNEIRALFMKLNDFINPINQFIEASELKGGKFELSFDQVVKIRKKELNSLSESSRTFGCMPSYNVYQPMGERISKINVDPAKYLYRGGGGHIHLGHCDDNSIKQALKNYDIMVPVLDIIVGNTCVMLDKNPLNKERRKNYGRAGEYRMPEYGVEYRTLSNFWLKDYQLMSLVTGLSRLAVNIVANSNEKRDFAKELMALVDQKDIVKAINNNDATLAKKNFDKIKGFVESITRAGDNVPLAKGNIKKFEAFVERGIDHYFKGDPVKNWIDMPEGHTMGFENFLSSKVRELEVKQEVVQNV